MTSVVSDDVTIPRWTFGDRLRKARRHRGISQNALAEHLGVPVSRLSNWEAGYNRPRDIVAVAVAAAEYLKVPGEWLAGFTPDPSVGVQNLKFLNGPWPTEGTVASDLEGFEAPERVLVGAGR